MFPPNPSGTSDNLIVTSASQKDFLATVTAKHSPDAGIDPDSELLQRAQDDFRQCVSWEQPWREKAENELKFVDALEHWDAGMKEERRGRPCLTFDRIGPSIDQVVNDARQNPPEAKVAPVGAGADKDTAELLQGLLRNIDQDSGAVIAYLTAYEHAVKVGRGWWRVGFEYENEDTIDADAFHQKIVIKRVRNPFSVYPDPTSQEFDYKDMKFCFVTEDLSLADFKREHPDAMTASVNFEGVGDKIRTDWFPRGSIRIAEYWWVETTEEEICQLNDGRVFRLVDAPPGAIILNRRLRRERVVHGVKMTGSEILSRWKWPGKYIPIIPVLGKEIYQDGKISLRGMVRPAMDANLSFDYLMSKQVETIGLSSIVQWLVPEGAVEGYEYQWAQANRKALAFMEYKFEVNGQQVPPPTRIFSTPPVEAITDAIAHMDEAGKTSLATWNPSLGAPSPEASGRAITARQRESDNAHFNFHDNLMRSIRHSARVVLDVVPHIYSEERLVSIVNPDGSNKQVMINQAIVEKGLQKIYNTKTATRCDITVSEAPSYANRRAEGADKLLQVIPTIPSIAVRAPDLVIRALDIPDGDQIADRIRPPDVQADVDGQAPVPPQTQAMVAQQHQIITALSAELQAIKQTLEAKILDIESRERIATQTNTAKILAAAETGKSAAAQSIAEMSHDRVENDLDRRAELLNTGLSIDADAHQAEAQRQHEIEQQQQAQQEQPQGAPTAQPQPQPPPAQQ